VSPQLFDNQIAQVRQIARDKRTQAHRTLWNDVPEEAQIFSIFPLTRNGGYGHSMLASGFERIYITYYTFLRYLNESYYPASRDVEFARDNVLRKEIRIDGIRNIVSFFNPIVLFNDIGAKIAGNSRADYLRFLQDGRAVRDDLINIGVRDGWILDYRFFAVFADKYIWGCEEEFISAFELDHSVSWNDRIQAVYSVAERFSFEMPVYKRYEQPNYSFGEIFARIATVLGLFVVSILGLWILTWVKFMRYDVR